jgi:hypothetical protein
MNLLKYYTIGVLCTVYDYWCVFFRATRSLLAAMAHLVYLSCVTVKVVPYFGRVESVSQSCDDPVCPSRQGCCLPYGVESLPHFFVYGEKCTTTPTGDDRAGFPAREEGECTLEDAERGEKSPSNDLNGAFT